MISKLRTKFTVFSFVSVCMVFLMGLAVLLGIGYARLKDERVARLDNELNRSDWRRVTTSSIAGLALAEYDLEQNSFVWLLKGDGFGISDERLNSCLDTIVSRGNASGNLGLDVTFSKAEKEGVLRIALYDRHYNNGRYVKYTVYSVIALAVGSACYLVISRFLAGFAMRPVEKIWNKQKQFVADASHELKTPLAVIRANTELIASHGSETVESQMHWIENTRFETERMTELVNSLLFLAKNDEGLKEETERIDFSECVESVVLAQEVLLYEKGKSFSYNVTNGLYVTGNDGQLRRLVAILLDNAAKYSLNEGNITLKLSQVTNVSGKFAELKVSNDCNPLTDEQLEHLFDRFYTVDGSRDKANAGHGLGLAIAQAVCENHQGSVSVAYADNRITFSALLPIAKASASKKGVLPA